ncbi:MAG: hypothetical protein A2622_13135 [Bdellovibrionales bacterium RIFCSPHIGHO2_01_FULL_40_29]|nr:MAG: hypothetical protein A2622_13135 [Bdellovibrionales bacterium RIFCSPHIGHO2_01_FULL_40_29]OFZ33366.1 MAG: hypothetical protein A3D17_13750 [Bdellovibrionales bacterium RIFCSPHIGHO2_02_FULL_40_15]
MKIKVIICLLFFGAEAILATDEVCFKNQDEYQAIKEKLPKIVQTIPVYLTHKSFLASAVGSVQFVDGTIRFFFNGTSLVVNEPIEKNISICASDKMIRLVFPVKPDENIAISGPTEVKLRGKLAMTLTNEAGFKKISRVIAESSSGSGNNKSPSGIGKGNQ